MKKVLIGLLLVSFMLFIGITINKLIETKDYSRDSRHFFCLASGHCVTVWRTHSGVCYVIPGKYIGLTYPPALTESYITSPFTESMGIIWQKGTSTIIVNLTAKSQVIHESPRGVKIVDYNLNKKYNDGIFLYFDGNYQRYKKDVDFMTIEIHEEYAYGKDGKITPVTQSVP